MMHSWHCRNNRCHLGQLYQRVDVLKQLKRDSHDRSISPSSQPLKLRWPTDVTHRFSGDQVSAHGRYKADPMAKHGLGKSRLQWGSRLQGNRYNLQFWFTLGLWSFQSQATLLPSWIRHTQTPHFPFPLLCCSWRDGDVCSFKNNNSNKKHLLSSEHLLLSKLKEAHGGKVRKAGCREWGWEASKSFWGPCDAALAAPCSQSCKRD